MVAPEQNVIEGGAPEQTYLVTLLWSSFFHFFSQACAPEQSLLPSSQNPYYASASWYHTDTSCQMNIVLSNTQIKKQLLQPSYYEFY